MSKSEPQEQDLTAELKENARQWGADLVGVADTALLQGIDTRPEDLLDDFPRAVSVAVRLSDAVMNPIDDRPTELYAAHYQRVNDLLDRIALRVTNFLQDRGAHALPLPASQILDEEVFYSYLSHKAVAVAAGVGWQGKSLLLVTRQFGPRVRLITVLTDAPLTPDQPVKNKCGKCTICADACPAGAIHGQGTDSHYDDRSQAWDKNKCVTRLNQVAGQGHVYKYLCGVCVAACPWGRKGKRG